MVAEWYACIWAILIVNKNMLGIGIVHSYFMIIICDFEACEILYTDRLGPCFLRAGNMKAP
jgi:hypothetical protein